MHDMKPFFYILETSRSIALEKDTYFEPNSATQSLNRYSDIQEILWNVITIIFMSNDVAENLLFGKHRF